MRPLRQSGFVGATLIVAILALPLVAWGRTWVLSSGGNNANGLTAVTWKDSATGDETNRLNAADQYVVSNRTIYVSSADPALNTFTGRLLRIGSAGVDGTSKSTLYQYGGARAKDIPGDAVFEHDGLELACGIWRLRYQGRNYHVTGKVAVTATDELPFKLCDEGTRENSASTLTFHTSLSGSGVLLVGAGEVGANTNLVLNLDCDTSGFTGKVKLESSVHATAGWLCRAGLELGSRILPGTVDVGPESFLRAQSPTDRVEVATLVLRADSALVFRAAASRATGRRQIVSSTVAVRDSLQIEKGVRLSVEKPDALAGIVPDELDLLTVPLDCPLDPANFRVDFADPDLSSSELSVVSHPETGTKTLVLTCRQDPASYVEEARNKIEMSGSDWSDGLVPHAGAHYRVAPNGTFTEVTVSVPSSTASEVAYQFPGESLTLGRATSSYRALVNLQTPVFQVPLVAVLGKAQLNSLQTCELAGDILMASTARAVFEVWKSDRLMISGNLSGAGELILQGRGVGSSNPGGYFEFTGDNSDFAGSVNVTMTSGNAGLTPSGLVDQYGRRHFTTVWLHRGSDLGGAMPSVMTNGVRLGEWSELVACQSLAFDEPTRGFLIDGVARLNVTNAADTVIFAAPLTLAGSLRKTGPGTLVLANPAPLVATDASELVIQSGLVRCRQARAVDGLRVVFEGAGSGLVFDADPTDAALAEYGIVNLSSNAAPFAVGEGADGIPVAAEWMRMPELREKQVALMTVRREFAAEMEALIRLQVQTGFQARVVSIVRRPTVVDGFACETLLARVDSRDVLIRSQFKYGLERSDFIHKWYDRPLLQDTSYQAFNASGHSINVESWKRHAELGRLCGHGFAAFIATSGREDVIPRSQIPGYESVILTEMTGDTSFEGGSSSQVDTCVWVAEQALAMTNSYRIGGKIILTSYPSVTLGSLGFYAEVKRVLEARYPGRFAVMPYFNPFDGTAASEVKPESAATVAENIRTLLRTVDGLCLEPSNMVFSNRRTSPENFLEYVVPAIREVLAEPEFAGRPFGLLAHLGHENCYRWNYVHDCTGTKVFRDWLKLALALKPDFILGAEWDEENENTHHRPTLATGFTHQRLLRYSTSVLNGLPPPLYPGDDASIPNLVVSYRKALMAGEPIEVEVLNIPDGTFAGQMFTVALRWRDAEGRVVKSYDPQVVAADRLEAVWFKSLATELINEAVLKPELTVATDACTWTFSEQLWPVSLHVSRQQDFRWRKQPLRDIPTGVMGSLSVSAPDADGTVLVSGSVASPEELRSIEVLEGPDTVYMFDPSNPQPDADGSLRVKIVRQSSCANPTEFLTGEIRKRTNRGVSRVGAFNNAKCTVMPQSVVVNVPADEIDSTVFEVDVPPYFTGEVAATQLVSRGVYSFAADGGMNLLFRRSLTTESIPPPCRVREAEFQFRLRPSSPDSVLRLQTVDRRYRIGLPAVRQLGRLRHRSVRTAFFERDEGRVSEVDVDRGRLCTVDYVFDSRTGGVLSSGAGFSWDGQLCGNCATVAGYGGGDGGYGSPMYENGISMNTVGWPKTAPRFVTEADGTTALEFADCNFVALPQQLVPTYSQFTLELEVKPEEVTSKQGLLSSGANYFTLWIENGRVWASVFQRNEFFKLSGRPSCVVEGPTIESGTWQRITVSYDRRTIRVDVDGRQGTPVETSGDLMYSRYMALGTLGSEGFFRGRIRKLSVRPHAPIVPTASLYQLR